MFLCWKWRVFGLAVTGHRIDSVTHFVPHSSTGEFISCLFNGPILTSYIFYVFVTWNLICDWIFAFAWCEISILQKWMGSSSCMQHLLNVPGRLCAENRCGIVSSSFHLLTFSSHSPVFIVAILSSVYQSSTFIVSTYFSNLPSIDYAGCTHRGRHSPSLL